MNYPMTIKERNFKVAIYTCFLSFMSAEMNDKSNETLDHYRVGLAQVCLNNVVEQLFP